MRVQNFQKESPSKKHSRLLVWKWIEKAMGRKEFLKGPHFVIASKQAGDVSVLLGLGVPPTAIYAVDIDKHALAAAKDKCAKIGGQGVHFLQADFRNAPKLFEMVFASAFIDLCGCMNEKDIKALIEFPAKYKVYEFMIQREQGLVGELIQSQKVEKGNGIINRLRVLSSLGFDTNYAIQYQSSTLTSKGTLMGIAFGKNVVDSKKRTPVVHVVNWTYPMLDKQLMAPTKNNHLLYNWGRLAAAGRKAAITRKRMKTEAGSKRRKKRR